MAESTPVTNEKPKNSGCGCVAISCLVVFCVCISIFIAAIGFGLYTFNAVSSGVRNVGSGVQVLCDAQIGDLERIYRDAFTSGYRERVSFTDFRRLYTENLGVFSNCGTQFSDLTVQQLVESRVNIEYINNKTVVNLNLRGKDVTIELVPSGNRWLIDNLTIR